MWVRILMLSILLVILGAFSKDSKAYNKEIKFSSSDPDPFIMYWWKFRARIKKICTGNSEIQVRWLGYHLNYERKRFNPLFDGRHSRDKKYRKKAKKNLDEL